MITAWLATVLGQAPTSTMPKFRVSTNLILVDVQVRDRGGRPITRLQAKDFSLLEEGVPQAITFFQEVDLPLPDAMPSHTHGLETAATTPLPSRPSPDKTLPKRQGNQPEHDWSAMDKRIFILFFSTASSGLQEVRDMKTAAQQFLDRQFTANDAAAVLLYNNGLQMLADLTSDRNVLDRAVSRLDGANPETDTSLPGDDSSVSSLDSASFVADETEFALFDTNQQLSAIQSAANAFRDVSGRKALVYFSTGLTSRGIENDQELRLTTDLCNRFNISVYSVDARGLVALSPGGGANRAGGGGTSIFTGQASLNQLASLSHSQEGLITLAEETGGAALTDDNDLGKIFQQAQRDSSHYYLLGYTVPKAPQDGRFHKIEVHLDRENVRLTYRRGYSADKPYLNLSKAEREYNLLQTVMEDRSPSDFSVGLSAEYFPDTAKQYQVPLLLSLDYPQLRTQSGSETVNLEIILLARDLQDRTRAGVRDQFEIRPDPKQKDTHYIYQNLFQLDPGRYQLTAFVRDNRTGHIARSDSALELPAAGPVRAGSLVLAGNWKEPDNNASFKIKRGSNVTMITNPLLVQGRILIPRAGSSFYRGESLYVHVRIALDPGAPSGERYRIRLLGADQKKIYESDPKTVVLAEGRTGSIYARLPLNQLPAGSYRLEVEVTIPNQTPLQLVRMFDVQPSSH